MQMSVPSQSQEPHEQASVYARPPPYGMDNLGNTCFMASALHCLNVCPIVSDFFYSGFPLPRPQEPLDGPARAMYSLLHELVRFCYGCCTIAK
jgi:Ubiquitin carboxyl-terminal hydrolase